MKYTIYRDKAGEWRWRFTAENNEIIAVSSESYKDLEHCRHGIKLVKRSAMADVVTEN